MRRYLIGVPFPAISEMSRNLSCDRAVYLTALAVLEKQGHVKKVRGGWWPAECRECLPTAPWQHKREEPFPDW